MDPKELELWIKTEEGAAWLESQKAPLVAKRDELLEALRLSNGKAADQTRRAADLEKLLGEERKAVEKTVVDGELSRILKNARVMEPCIPGVLSELKEAYGLTVQANGADRKATGKAKGPDGSEREIDLESIVREWLPTDAGKAVTLAGGDSGGGAAAPRGAARVAPASLLDARSLARMSESDFQAALAAAKG